MIWSQSYGSLYIIKCNTFVQKKNENQDQKKIKKGIWSDCNWKTKKNAIRNSFWILPSSSGSKVTADWILDSIEISLHLPVSSHQQRHSLICEAGSEYSASQDWTAVQVVSSFGIGNWNLCLVLKVGSTFRVTATHDLVWVYVYGLENRQVATAPSSRKS